MSNTKTPTQPLAKVDNASDFKLPVPGVAFIHGGRTIDLRKVDRATAEILANDPKAGFIVWAEGKGPDAKAKAAPAAAAAAEKAAK
jgi:hypothetical protein